MVLVALALLASNAAFANVPFAGILESRFGRYLMMHTREGEELLSGVVAKLPEAGGMLTRQEILALAQERLSLPEFASHRTALESRMEEVLHKFEQQSRGIKRSASNKGMGALNRQERKLLEEIAAQELKANAEFFEMKPAANFKNSRDAFTSETPGPAKLGSETTVPVAQRPAASRRVKNFLDKMESCVAHAPANAAATARKRFILSQLAFDESISLGGAIVAAGGVEDIDYASLPFDLLYTAVASVGDSLVVARRSRFSVRWFKLVGASAAESGFDMTVYQIRQSLGQELNDNQLSTKQRFAYNTAWGTMYAPVSISLYNLVSGLECVGVNSGIILGIRAGVGVAGAATYYALRKATVTAIH